MTRRFAWVCLSIAALIAVAIVLWDRRRGAPPEQGPPAATHPADEGTPVAQVEGHPASRALSKSPATQEPASVTEGPSILVAAWEATPEAVLAGSAPDDSLVFRGRVLDAGTRSPIEGAVVTLFEIDLVIFDDTSEREARAGEVRTDRRGDFAVSIPGPDSWIRLLRVSAPSRATRLTEIRPGHESRPSYREIPLARGVDLRVSVAPSGPPRTTVTVRAAASRLAVDPEDRFPGRFAWQGVTDDAGHCTIAGLPAGVPLEIRAVRPGHPDRWWKEIELEEGGVREWPIAFDDGGTLTGTVVDQESRLVRDRQVWIVPRKELFGRDWSYLTPKHSKKRIARVEVDHDGVFRVRDLPAGEYWLGLEPETSSEPSPRALAPVAIPVTMPPAGELELVLPVWRGLFVEGRVQGPTGLPPGLWSVDGWRVDGWGEDEGLHVSTTSGDDGRFVLGPLQPGHLRVNVVTSSNWFFVGKPVDAEPGDPPVTISMFPSLRVRGGVTDTRTQQPAPASLLFVEHSEDAERDLFDPWSWQTTPEGLIDLWNIDTRRSTLVATTADGRIGLVTLIAPESGAELRGVEVRVAPGGRLRLRSAAPEATLRIEVLAGGIPIHVGTARFSSDRVLELVVPEGSLTVRAQPIKSPASASSVHEIELSAGETREIALGTR